jgi:hypothetical protein
MRRRLSPAMSAALLFILLSPGQVLAQWPSWSRFGTEGSYVHEMAHLLFFGAMLFFIHEIYRARLQSFPGFRVLVWVWALLAFWNLDAFIGHWADWTLVNPIILGEGFARKMVMYDAQTWLVYITKIDHFLFLVPAFYLFYWGLKTLVRNAEVE